jgi:hypothetical protein
LPAASVIPEEAGIQRSELDPRLRWEDEHGQNQLQFNSETASPI